MCCGQSYVPRGPDVPGIPADVHKEEGHGKNI